MIRSECITPELATGICEAPDRWAEAQAIRAFSKAVRMPDYSVKANDFQRFWPRVSFATSGCWIWTGYVDRLGYGATGGSGSKVRGETKAHRLAYRLFKGDIPEGLEVMHSCDVPCCVNPEHLRVGTHSENMRDAASKGRMGGQVRPIRPNVGANTGERNPMARLTRADVAEIRRRKAGGAVQLDLARQFGVSPMTISRAVRGETWQ